MKKKELERFAKKYHDAFDMMAEPMYDPEKWNEFVNKLEKEINNDKKQKEENNDNN